jgi:ribosomal protein S18 acetylase RimI-like enzyme
MIVPLQIRPACSSDASFAAKLMYLTMGSLADYLFKQDVPSIESSLARLFSRNAGRFGYQVTAIAETEGDPVGMIVACEGSKLNRINLKTFPHFFPALGIKNTLGLLMRGVTLPGGAEAKKDEYYISNLGILPSAQGRGFGSQLLQYAEQTARACGLSKCSLIVSSHNDGAHRLYERTGYRVVESVPDQNEIPGYYRMVKTLQTL